MTIIQQIFINMSRTLISQKKNSISNTFGKKSQLSIDKDLRSETSDQFENLER